MNVDPTSLKPGDRIRTQTGDRASEATVLAVDGGDIFARNNFGCAFVTDGQYWELVPPPPLIDPEQVWCMYSPSETIYPDLPSYGHSVRWPRFRITQIEVVE
jgi:hypothetical protein